MLGQVIAKSGSSNEYVSMNISMDNKNRKKNNSQLKSKKIMVDYIFSLQV